jgi:hypothetical protein
MLDWLHLTGIIVPFELLLCTTQGFAHSLTFAPIKVAYIFFLFHFRNGVLVHNARGRSKN